MVPWPIGQLPSRTPLDVVASQIFRSQGNVDVKQRLFLASNGDRYLRAICRKDVARDCGCYPDRLAARCVKIWKLQPLIVDPGVEVVPDVKKVTHQRAGSRWRYRGSKSASWRS